ncbi:MAG: RNA polymerase subunit sigma-70 [Ignavibacteriae bacterium HGW-Ignavibacteriae-2]|jgi:RNA polymerase sigma-70 factor (ECF subfamily)|nr:sigma-70 family RNA polymerase sigma factor [Bacteroidota bacterium]PKL89826.1 MAG: RNA polymerase subunit sigma-70 [Ignavibacteriae bacterium HGW-Ignavibacteriae-2]
MDLNLNSENSSNKDQEILDRDFVLINEYIDGDDSAFEKLINLHKDKVRNLVYLTLGDSEFVDDISQDVFISVFHKVKEFRFESKFTTWLYRITVNKCRDYLRKKRVRSIFTPIKDSHNELGVKAHSENLDIPQLVRAGIQKLPEKLKVPLILRDIDGLSYKEIADQLECEVGTVKSRIFRARESLKLILEPYHRELSA